MNARKAAGVLAAALVWAGIVLAGGASGQEEPAAPEHPERAAAGPGEPGRPDRDKIKKLWRGLPDERKAQLLERLKKFRDLPPESQEEMRRRHEQLERLRARIAADEKEALGGLSPAEQKEFLDRKVREELRKTAERIGREKPFHGDGGDPGGRGEPGGRGDPGGMGRHSGGPPPLPDPRRDRRLHELLREKNAELADRVLEHLAREGAIPPEEKEHILSLPPEEKVDRVLGIQQQLYLRALRDAVPPEELERFREMPLPRFNEELNRQRREHGLFGAFARLSELTAEQRVAVDAAAPGEEREEMRRAFFDANFRERLRAMGVEEETVERLLSLPPPVRVMKVREHLRNLPPDQVPPEMRFLLEKGPRNGNGNGNGGRGRGFGDGAEPPPPSPGEWPGSGRHGPRGPGAGPPGGEPPGERPQGPPPGAQPVDPGGPGEQDPPQPQERRPV